MKRQDGRTAKEIRPVRITRKYLKHPAGSVLIEMGDTKVICTASVAESVPHHKKNTGQGWVTAEYAMLPGATADRSNREHMYGRTRGRTQEIQRLIGRSLRAVVDLEKLGERTIYIDADVIQADGGTRTAAITGSFVALSDAVEFLLKADLIDKNPISEHLAAISAGVVQGKALLDLPYYEDSIAEVDINVVMTESGKFIEVQGTAEGIPFSKERLDELLDLSAVGIKKLIKKQKEVLAK